MIATQPPLDRPLIVEPPSKVAPPLTCGTPNPTAELNQQARWLQSLLEKAERLTDPAARSLIQECLQSVLELHGQGLARILGLLQQPGDNETAALERVVNDPLISGLLLIHGLHPLDLPTRLRQALDKVRPYMESHGGNVELVSLDDGVARLHLNGTCKTCPSSSVTLELAVRSALEEACPDLTRFEIV